MWHLQFQPEALDIKSIKQEEFLSCHIWSHEQLFAYVDLTMSSFSFRSFLLLSFNKFKSFERYHGSRMGQELQH